MTLDKEWIKFSGGPHLHSRQEVRVTINFKGLIYFNQKAYDVFGRPKAVAIYYNPGLDAIALEPAYERFAQNFKFEKKQVGWAIHAATFCRHHKIRIPNTERFIHPDITKDGHMILNLRETVTVGGIATKKKKRESQNQKR